MKNTHRNYELSLLLFLSFLLGGLLLLANFVETDKKSPPLFLDENNPGTEGDIQNQPGTTDQSELYYFLPQPERLDTCAIDLCDPARSYVDNTPDVFMEAYPPISAYFME